MAGPEDSRGPESVDFLVIAPMEEECLAILRRLGHYRTVPSSQRHDPRVYHLSTVRSAPGAATFSIVITQLLQIGRVEAGHAAKDGIRRWNPRCVILAGIAGGVAKNGVRIGDVLVADFVHDYELQKLTEDGPLPRRQSYPVSPRLLAAAQNFFGDTWADGLSDKGPRPHRIVGPMASGDKVLADSKALDWLLRNCSSKLIGVEMEAGGVASAAHQSGVPFFMVRAASDLADPQKDTPHVLDRRAYACDVAATYLVRLLESGLIAPQENLSTGGGNEIAATVQQHVSMLGAEFVGRAAETRRFLQFLDSHSGGVLLVTAGAGYGKSALLAHWVDLLGRAGTKVASYFFSREFALTSVDAAYRYLAHNLVALGVTDGDSVRDISAAPARALYNAITSARLAAGERLIVVVDALDEADTGISRPPFPPSLPTGVFVVASVRAGESEHPEQLTQWFNGADRLPLQALGADDVRAWLAHTASGALAALAADRVFVDDLMRRTEGFPLYLHHLLEELRDDVAGGGNGRDVLARTPQGFYAYVRRQLRDLAALEPRASAEPILALLSVVLGPISESDIQIVTSLSAFDLLSLPTQVRRWFTVRRLAADRVVYSLGHPLLAKEFATALAASVDRSRSMLVEHCSRWREHRGAYALQYYANHLRVIDDRQGIYSLARDDEFRHLQEITLPEQPTINLAVIHAALETAAAEDNIPTIVEFLLRHHDQLCRILKQSPLEAFRSGQLKRAWALADVYPADYAVLWQLLFAAEAMETNQPGKAAAVVTRLSAGALPEFGGWKQEYATELLLRAIDLQEVVALVTTRRCVADEGQTILSQALLDRGLTTEAAMAARILSSGLARQDQLTKVATVLQARFEQQCSRGDLHNAEITRRQALGLLEEVLGKERLDDILLGVGPSENPEPRPSAQELAKDLLDRWDRERTPEERQDDASSKISLERAEAGAFPAAFAAANAIHSEHARREVMWKIIVRQAAVGDHEALRDMIRSITQKDDRERAWSAASLSYAESSDLVRAAEAAEQLDPNEWWSVEAFRGLAVAQAKAGNFTASLATTGRMSRRWDSHHGVLLFIAERQREAGLDADARSTLALGIVPDIQGYEEIKDLSRDELLTLRGTLLTLSGQLDEASRTALQVSNTYDRGSLLCDLAERYAKSRMFDPARSLADKIESDWQRRRAFETLAVEQVKAGQAALAIVSVAGIRVAKDRIGALCAIAKEELAIADRTGAVATVDIALREADAIEFGHEKVLVLGEAAQVLTSAGAAARAQDLLTLAAPKVRDLPDGIDRRSALRYLAEAYAKTRRFDEALALSEELEGTDDQGGVLYVIATEQAKASNVNATRTASRIRDITHRISAWCWVARAQHHAGDLTAATAAMESAVDSVAVLEKPEDQAEALATIGEGWAAIGRQSNARVSFEQARQLADALDEDQRQRIALHELASAQARAGYFDAARENAERIHEHYPRESVLSLIAMQQAETGKGADAVRTFEAIRFDAMHQLNQFVYALGRGKNAVALKTMLVAAPYHPKAVLAFATAFGRLFPVHAGAMADRVLAFLKKRALQGSPFLP